MEKCKIITVANEKGGGGKTATCHNLGAALISEGKRVLLVDLNHQARKASGTQSFPNASDTTEYWPDYATCERNWKRQLSP